MFRPYHMRMSLPASPASSMSLRGGTVPSHTHHALHQHKGPSATSGAFPAPASTVSFGTRSSGGIAYAPYKGGSGKKSSGGGARQAAPGAGGGRGPAGGERLSDEHFQQMQDLMRSRMNAEGTNIPEKDREMLERLMKDRESLELMSRYMAQPVHPDELTQLGVSFTEKEVDHQKWEYDRYQEFLQGEGVPGWEPPTIQELIEQQQGGGGVRQQQMKKKRATDATTATTPSVPQDAMPMSAMEDDPFRRSDMEMAMKQQKRQQQKRQQQKRQQQKEEVAQGQAVGKDAVSIEEDEDVGYQPEDTIITEEKRAVNARLTRHYYREIVRRIRQLSATTEEEEEEDGTDDDTDSYEMSMAVVRKEFRISVTDSEGRERQDLVEEAFQRAQRMIQTLDAEIAASTHTSSLETKIGSGTEQNDEDGDDDDDGFFLHDRETLASTAQEMEYYWKEYYQQDGAVGEWYTNFEELENGGHLPAFSRDMDVLVVGGGLSLLGAHILPYVRTVTDIDICQYTISAMQKVYSTVPTIDFHKMDVRAMKFDANKFDLVVDKATFDWIMSRDQWGVADVQIYESQVWRVLKPGGSLMLVTTTPKEGVQYMFGGYPWTIEYEGRESIIHPDGEQRESSMGFDFDMAIYYFRLRKPLAKEEEVKEEKMKVE